MKPEPYRTEETSANIIQRHSEWVRWCMRNWARWLTSGDTGWPEVPTSCASAERAYRVAWWEIEDAEPREAYVAPDERAGELVETIVTLLPVRPRDVIRMQFFQLPDGRVRSYCIADGHDFTVEHADDKRARRMSLPLAAYLDHLRAGMGEIDRQLHARVMLPLTPEQRAEVEKIDGRMDGRA